MFFLHVFPCSLVLAICTPCPIQGYKPLHTCADSTHWCSYKLSHRLMPSTIPITAKLEPVCQRLTKRPLVRFWAHLGLFHVPESTVDSRLEILNTFRSSQLVYTEKKQQEQKKIKHLNIQHETVGVHLLSLFIIFLITILLSNHLKSLTLLICPSHSYLFPFTKLSLSFLSALKMHLISPQNDHSLFQSLFPSPSIHIFFPLSILSHYWCSSTVASGVSPGVGRY